MVFTTFFSLRDTTTSMRTGIRMVALVVLCIASGISSAAADDVLGLWASNGSILEITRAGNTLSARVIALEDATYVEGEEFGPVGAARRDDRNPDEALRRTPMLGLELLNNYELKGKKWEGEIYDPESGKTYSSKMHVEKGELKMRGYIGMPMFGRTATFRPVSRCADDIKRMLLAINRSDCDG